VWSAGTSGRVKTAIAQSAEVKMSRRLVPNMSCQVTFERIRASVAERFPDVEVHGEPGLEP
jgi:acetylornithine deacetylase/succinyl-diaminopimelate desuccinylase-like protein